MKSHRLLILAAALGAGVVFAPPARAQGWTAVEITAPNGSASRPYGINNAGQVVGWYLASGTGQYHAFITGPNGVGMTDLGAGDGTVGTAINDAGQVAISPISSFGSGPGYITGPNGVGLTALGFLPQPTADAENYPNAINNSGQVAGYCYGANAGVRPPDYSGFITGGNGVGMTDLGTLESQYYVTLPHGINDSGQVVGDYGQSGAWNKAFMTGANGAGIHPLYDAIIVPYSSAALAINNAGQVTGWTGMAPNGGHYAFVTGPNGIGMTNLGTLSSEAPGGNTAPSIGFGINNAGVVVGSSYMDGGGTHAFIAGLNGAGMIDLNSLVTQSHPDSLTVAYGINDKGQVIAEGYQGRAYLLTPPAPLITTQPTAQTVAPGGNASFTAAATGAFTPTLKWQVSTDSGSSWADLTDTAPYSGTTTGTLTITGATNAMNGYRYRCAVTNSVDPVASDGATLTVVPARPPYFDAAGYLSRNADLAALFGSLPDWADQAWKHYWLYGLNEGRTDGDFNPAAYLAMYPDLQAALGGDLHAAALHWYTYGRAEGRRIPAGFDARGYLARYPDLAAVFGNDLYGAWLHYLNFGVIEGRVFDTKFRAGEYPLLYGDLATLEHDPRGALLHWLNYGRAEGRMGRVPAGFDVPSYLSRYPDLAAVFGSLPYPQQWVAAWDHYVNYGINEGRTDGDFDPEAYLTMYGDLRAAFGDNWTLAAMHWYRYGRYEGRRIPAGFDARGYLGRYADLQLALGDDLYGAWLQYLDWGVNEGRVYDEIFRVDEYLAMYPDLRAAFGDDRQKALLHWLYYGQYEGRLGRFP